MRRQTLVLIGHANPESYCHALAHAYVQGYGNAPEIQLLDLAQLNFDPILRKGYQQRQEWEIDLQFAWDAILHADHLVLIYPTWWGGMPALLKGFFDRLFLPGMAFKMRENSVLWDKLLQGKTCELITTMDTPVWFYRMIYHNHGVRQLKQSILEFCGIQVKKIYYFSVLRSSSRERRLEWLQRMHQLGAKRAGEK